MVTPGEGREVEPSLLGKRYSCGRCGTEVLCTKPGRGAVHCCDTPMQLKATKPLPSAD